MVMVMARLLLLILLAACTTPDPTPFKKGAERLPPSGCIEYRKEGGHC